MRDLLTTKLNLATSKIKPYEGFVFLCGGPTDIRSPHPVSIRDAIYRELAKDDCFEKRIRVAEDFKDWSHEATYRDLVSFERHIAELSSVIVIVLESAGAIAELGLFSAIEEFNTKLLVFVETQHYQADSFIRLGPIEYLEKTHANLAECHRWTKLDSRFAFDPVAATELQADLASAIRGRASKPTPERLFNSSGWLDMAFLVCDILSLYSALTLRELRHLITSLEVECNETSLKQTLFLLERVRLVVMEPKGDQRYYVCLDERQFIRFSLKGESGLDFMRFRTDLLAEYAKTDKKRFRVIQEVRTRYGQ